MNRLYDETLTASVKALMDSGLGYKAVARTLGIDRKTAKRHAGYAGGVLPRRQGVTLVPTTCRNCGVEFGAQPSKLRNGAGKYCSVECSRAAQAAPRIESPCRTCGTPVVTLASRVRNGVRVFCSRECAAMAVRKPRAPTPRSMEYTASLRAEEEIAAEARRKQVPAMRRCLGGCGIMFASSGAQNRVCDACRGADEWSGVPAHSVPGVSIR